MLPTDLCGMISALGSRSYGLQNSYLDERGKQVRMGYVKFVDIHTTDSLGKIIVHCELSCASWNVYQCPAPPPLDASGTPGCDKRKCFQTFLSPGKEIKLPRVENQWVRKRAFQVDQRQCQFVRRNTEMAAHRYALK